MRRGRASRWTGWRAAAGGSPPRAGGERIRLREGGPTRTLKNLLQEHAVPAWRRARLPLLFEGDRLVWVPGIGIAADFHARGPGLLPQWDGSTEPVYSANRRVVPEVPGRPVL